MNDSLVLVSVSVQWTTRQAQHVAVYDSYMAVTRFNEAIVSQLLESIENMFPCHYLSDDKHFMALIRRQYCPTYATSPVHDGYRVRAYQHNVLLLTNQNCGLNAERSPHIPSNTSQHYNINIQIMQLYLWRNVLDN